MKIVEKKEKSLFDKELALKSNLKKRKQFKKKYKLKKRSQWAYNLTNGLKKW